jgi:translation initiation factor 2 subunit 3
MDGALLLIAANEPCPQPQTIEHLMALEIAGVKNVIVIQNKIDLLSKEKLLDHYNQIREFLKGTWIEDAPIIPISAHHDVNIDVLIEAIEDFIPTPELDTSLPAQMSVARSFDVNKPGTKIDRLKGGVLGGSLKTGVLHIGDEIEIRPGMRTPGDASRWEAMFTEVVSLMAGGRPYDEIKPGGLAGVGTLLDPYYTKADNLIGNLIGEPGTLPPVLSTMTLDVELLDKMVVSHGFGPATTSKVEPISTNTPLMLSVGTATTVGIVTSAREDVIDVKLKLAVCAKEGTKVAISRREGGRWRLIGYGVIQ